MKKIVKLLMVIFIVLFNHNANALCKVCVSINGGVECGISDLSCSDEDLLECLGNNFPQGWTCIDSKKLVISKLGFLYRNIDGRVFVSDAGTETKVLTDDFNRVVNELIRKFKIKEVSVRDFKRMFEAAFIKNEGKVSDEKLKKLSEELNIPIKKPYSKSLRGTKFEEKKDFVWNDPLLMKVLGYESITFKKGIYQITNEGTITLNILTTGKPQVTPSQNLIRITASGTKQYRGMDCFLFGFSCCVYDKVPTKENEPVDYQFALKDGKAVTLTIQFRGTGSPKQARF